MEKQSAWGSCTLEWLHFKSFNLVIQSQLISNSIQGSEESVDWGIRGFVILLVSLEYKVSCFEKNKFEVFNKNLMIERNGHLGFNGCF